METLANTLNGFKGTVTEQNPCHGEVKLFRCTKEGKLMGGIPCAMKNFFFLYAKGWGWGYVYIVPQKVRGKCIL